MSQLSAYETALARSRAYALLGRLWLEGLTPELHALVVDLAGLAAHLPEPYDPDAAAARHQQLLGFEFFPFQSYFLDAGGLVGGAESTRVQESYAALGFVGPDDVAPDHLGVELLALGHLAGAEVDARRDDLVETAARMVALQQQFLAEHLSRWIIPICAAVEQADDPWYAALARLTLTLVADSHPATPALLPDSTFPPAAPPDPDDTDTSLQDLATYLLTPVRSGLFISQRDLRAAGRRLDLPGGFGNRRQLLLNMMRAAVTYEQFPHLTDALLVVVTARTDAYRAIAKTLAAPAAPWLDRITTTRDLLGRVAELAEIPSDKQA